MCDGVLWVRHCAPIDTYHHGIVIQLNDVCSTVRDLYSMLELEETSSPEVLQEMETMELLGSHSTHSKASC